ncbi:hypothetical protein CWR48_19115 [Oceanobacillus arenosus]|uniref:Uncharacterized protein n=1 Tax=Oceanobacillus arenosus TaxID=1229153 RepID=A0A3D8PIC0_9BACI|nr:hypothetical protein [Oceanobacillus arenosus]RDW15836.1 hypothetical protein CWR48_19115 [Oceanobacillus arenosus]
MSNEDQTKKPSEMNPDELPDVRAFEDEFTRGFLQSTEESRPGYYPFLSGTGKYVMDFPAGGVVGEDSYAIKEEDYEGLSIGVDNDNGTGSYFKLNYDSLDEKGQEDTILDMINHQFNGELEFDKFTSGNSTLYLSYFEDDETYYGYAGFLQNEVANGGIRIIYETECIGGKEACEGINAENKDIMKQLIESIHFTLESNESDRAFNE